MQLPVKTSVFGKPAFPLFATQSTNHILRREMKDRETKRKKIETDKMSERQAGRQTETERKPDRQTGRQSVSQRPATHIQ